MDERKARIRAFLGHYFKNHEWRDDDDIFEQGFVNSLFAIQLISFLEKEFTVAIDDEDLDLANFRTIQAMDGLVGRKLASA